MNKSPDKSEVAADKPTAQASDEVHPADPALVDRAALVERHLQAELRAVVRPDREVVYVNGWFMNLIELLGKILKHR